MERLQAVIYRDPAEVGDRAEGVPREGRRGGGRVAGSSNAVELVPAGRRRSRAASRVAPDAAGREPLVAGETHTETHTTGIGGEKAPQRNPLRGLVFDESGRVDLNHRPPGPEPGALTGLRYAPLLDAETPRRVAVRSEG